MHRSLFFSSSPKAARIDDISLWNMGFVSYWAVDMDDRKLLTLFEAVRAT